ncbi:MAG TPA: hypothetical protein PK585_13515, partial [Amphiplicatus sp.]|nr:hypothetical protein [Amphiplicatus sp.]
KSFADLGITTKDTTEQALDKAFKALAGISDQSVRTSYATKIFGDDARRMALIVADGADSLDKAREQSRDLGFVLSGELAKKAEEASDRLADMDLLLKNRVSEAVLQNVDGFLSFKQAINDVQIALVEFTAKIGAAYDAGRRFLRLPADAPNEKALRSERADLVTQVDKVRKEREGLVSGKGLFNRIGNVENRIAGADRFIAIREQRIAEIDAALELLSKKADATPITGATDGISNRTATETGAATVDTKKADDAAKAISDKLKDLVAETRTPLEALQAKLIEIQEIQPFAQTPEQIEAVRRALEGYAEEIQNLDERTRAWRETSEAAARGISNALADAIVYGENLGQTLKNLAKQLSSRLISEFLFKGISTVIGLPIDGARAAGGPVLSGRSYLVGERGPEIFSPSSNGTIIPNGAGGGGSVIINQNLHFDVGLETVENRIAALTPGISASVVEAVVKAQRRPRFSRPKMSSHCRRC